MRIKNIDELKSKIRPFLKSYLAEHRIDTSTPRFRCPNHKAHKNNDNNPSAGFFPDDTGWNCFTCEGSGDIFTAAYYLEGKPLRGNEFILDNVIPFAKKYKIQFEVTEETEDEKYQKKIYSVLELTANYCHKYLLEKQDKRTIKYISDRGWEKNIKQFHFGYSPTSRLYSFLKSRHVTDQMIVDAGLTTYDENGKFKTPFLVIENRLIIPWRNYFGRICAFTSRALDSSTMPKYLHSYNSVVHEKTRELFNLYNAKKDSDILYVVESNASVLTLVSNGVANCVALLGSFFTSEQYDLLVRLGITRLIISLDNDDAGMKAIEKFIYDFKDKKDIQLYVKELPRDAEEDKSLKDPDDFIKKFGIDKFVNLPELNAFDWTLSKFAVNKDEEKYDRYKEILISQIIIEGNFLKREKLVKKFSECSDVTQKSILQEIEKYTTQKESITSVKEVIDAKESLISDINEFEEKVWKRSSELLGIDTGWPMFNRIFDGLQEGFYIVAGRTNIGKSAFNISLAYNLLKLNQNSIYILYFNVDDSTYKCIGRMISIDSRIPINWIKNPKFKITLNEKLIEEQKEELLERRDTSINYIKTMTQSLSFKNTSNVEDVERIIKIYNTIAESERKKLIVFVDKVHNLGSIKKLEKRQLTDHVSVTLKNLVNAYDIPIIGSLEVTKNSIMSRPTEADIKETQKLEDDSDATILLYSAHKVDPNTQFVFTEDGVTYPIAEACVPKNKLNDLSGYDTKIFYKFYPHLSCYQECSEEDQRRYSSIAP